VSSTCSTSSTRRVNLVIYAYDLKFGLFNLFLDILMQASSRLCFPLCGVTSTRVTSTRNKSIVCQGHVETKDQTNNLNVQTSIVTLYLWLY
jgi:hypothetical protein